MSRLRKLLAPALIGALVLSLVFVTLFYLGWRYEDRDSLLMALKPAALVFRALGPQPISENNTLLFAFTFLFSLITYAAAGALAGAALGALFGRGRDQPGP